MRERIKTPRMMILHVLILGVFLSLFLKPANCLSKRPAFPMAKIRVLAILAKDDMGKSFSFPMALAYDRVKGEIYVLDSARSRLVIFTSDLFPLFSMGKGRGIFSPRGITLDEKGNIYICQGRSSKDSRPKISVFNAAGIKIRDLYIQGFKGATEFFPKSVALGKTGHIYVAGIDFPGVLVLDNMGNFLKLIAPEDHLNPMQPLKKAKINDVYVDKNGRLYLLSEEMGRFYVYDINEHFLFSGGKKGGSYGELSRPRGICADPREGLIYVVDYMRHVAQGYDYNTGKLKFEFGGRGWGPGWFNYPTDITVDKFGRIYITDLFNHRIQVIKVVSKHPTQVLISPSPSFLPVK